jgi:hypothetical protein
MKQFFRKIAFRLRTPPPEHWRLQLLKLPWLLLFPIALWMKEAASRNSPFVEKYYSSSVYPVITQIVGFLFGWIHASVAEFLIYALVAIIPIYIIVQIILLFVKKDRILRAYKTVINIAMVASIGYFLFIGLWGLNYYRQPLAVTLGYTVAPQSVSNLMKLCTELAKNANMYRTEVKQAPDGHMVLEESKKDALLKVPEAYQSLSTEFPTLKSRFALPKPVLLSRELSYTNIEGIFIPFTMEPNVNVDMPDSGLLSAACHEAAHAQGFAREDEANFLSYLACMASGDPELQYSGTLLALTISMNSLATYNSEAFNEIASTYSQGVRDDMSYESAYWQQFAGPVAETEAKVNNAYLISNKQTDGVQSYGRMVDLLLARMLEADKK